MKKLLSIVLALAMLLTLTTVAASAETADEGTWKVAILTGTTSQGEEEFRAAEKARMDTAVYMSCYPFHGRKI